MATYKLLTDLSEKINTLNKEVNGKIEKLEYKNVKLQEELNKMNSKLLCKINDLESQNKELKVEIKKYQKILDNMFILQYENSEKIKNIEDLFSDNNEIIIKKVSSKTNINKNYRFISYNEANNNIDTIKKILGEWDIAQIEYPFLVNGSGYGNRIYATEKKDWDSKGHRLIVQQ